MRVALLLFVAVAASCMSAESGPLCDDDLDNDGDGRIDCADAHCILAVECSRCGNGIVDDDSEACDDGNHDDDDGCSASCLLESCGNGELDPGEQCDDGNADGGDGCNFACRIDRCGDGLLQTGLGEECEDGNRVGGDGCSSRCKIEVDACGDGVVQFQVGEECDDGNRRDDDGCSSLCRVEFCGDRRVQEGRGEECEPPDGVSCDFSCQRVRCGDGEVDPAFFEECDDGNRRDGDGCSFFCRAERCGDGILTAGEQCDDGNPIDGDGCSIECRSEVCGDGVRQARLGELCDGQPDCDARCRVIETCVGIDGEVRACFDVDEGLLGAAATFASIQDRGELAPVAWLGGTFFGTAQPFEIRDGELAPTFIGVPRQPFLVLAADMARDQRSELVMASFDGSVSVLDDQQREVEVAFLNGFPIDVDVGDLGGDASLDAAVITNQRVLGVLRDPFSARHTLDVTLPRGASSVLIAPVVDGAPIVLYASDELLVSVRIDGGGLLEDEQLELPGRIADMVRADVNADGRDDVVALTLAPDQLVAIELDGLALPDTFRVLAPLAAGDRLSAGDVDFDGANDIVVSRSAGLAQIAFARDGYAPATSMPVPFNASSAAIADVDGDLDGDLVIGGGFFQGQAFLYTQQ